MDLTIECRNLSKAYAHVPALRELNFEARTGEVVAITGDNGAGKSTLLKVLATLLQPDSGQCRVRGVDLPANAVKARAMIGYVGHDSMLDRVLTLRENLHFFADLYGAPGGRAESLIERLGAHPFADTAVGELSRGQEQAAALCRALVHQPKVLLLDEPFNALDVSARVRLCEVLKEESAGGATVLFSTHDHDGAKALATRVAHMKGGQFA